MELLVILLDAAPVPPLGGGIWSQFIAAVSALAGAIVLGAAALIKKVTGKNKEDKGDKK